MMTYFPSDIARYFAAVFFFGIVIVPPGFVIAWSANLLGFRSRNPVFRLYSATAIGLAIVPAFLYLCWSLGSIRFAWLLYGILWTSFAALLALRKIRLKDLLPPRPELFMAAAWIVLCAAIVLDLHAPGRVYINLATDHSFRTSVINAIRHTDVLPATNPFFNPGHPLPFRYHYYWFMLAAFAQIVSGGLIDSRDALFASIAWAALALVAVAALFLPGQDQDDLRPWRRRTWFAAALLSVTGLDLIPVGFTAIVASMGRGKWFLPYADLEAWNHDGQVTSWLGSFVWVPNHIGGLVCGLTAVLLALWACRATSVRDRIAGSIASGLGFASAAGCSIFVVFVFLVALAALFFVEAFRRNWRTVAVLALVGLVALVAALPYLRELRAQASGTPFAVLRPRTFGPVFWVLHETPATLDTRGVAAMLLCLPLNYGLELGFFAAVALWKLRSVRRNGWQGVDRMQLYLLAAGLFIGSFFASVVLSHNDLGARSMLLVQFVLLLWAVEWLEETLATADVRATARRRAGARFTIFLALFGLAGTLCDALLLRSYAIAIDHGRGASLNPELIDGVGARTADLRQIYTVALKALPPDALVQENPMVLDGVQQGLYSAWGSAARGREYGPYYGGDPAEYMRTVELLRPVFEQSVGPGYLAGICSRMHIGALVVQEFDPAWREPESWIWSTPAVYPGKHARAYTCAGILGSSLSLSASPSARRE